MILFWFILGVLAIFAIARYNESDNLFWKLFFSFVVAFTVTTIAVKMQGGNQDKKDLTVQVYPTQAPTNTIDSMDLLSLATVSNVTDSVPASKDNTPVIGEVTSYRDGVYGWSRDQPPRVINVNGKLYPLNNAFSIDSS